MVIEQPMVTQNDIGRPGVMVPKEIFSIGMELSIFGKNSGTNGQGILKFYGVTDFSESLNEITFHYISTSTGNKKEALFYTVDLMGFSKTF